MTLGLSLSSEDKASAYIEVAKEYLDTKYENCQVTKFSDLGGRIFEIFSSCTDEAEAQE